MVAPYGSWSSPIAASALAAAAPRLDDARYVDGVVWWGQSMPEENGRLAVWREGDDAPVLPAPWNARSRVNEYGGGAWGVTASGVLVFVEAGDQRVWALRPQPGMSAQPTPLTPPSDGDRHGGLIIQGDRLLAIRETHADTPVPVRSIVEIPLDGTAAHDRAAVTVLVTGSDFYAQPRLSHDGTRLAWVAWDHPDMPWQGARVHVRAVEGAPDDAGTVVSEGAGLQPEWSADGSLVYADDRTGRWNLYRHDGHDGHDGHDSVPVAPADADTGGPLWVLGERWYAHVDGGILAVRTHGTDSLVLIDDAGAVHTVTSPVSAEATIPAVNGRRALVMGAGPTSPRGLWEIDLDAPDDARIIAGGTAPWGEAWLPVPAARTFAGPHGDVHTFVYPPTNPQQHADRAAPFVVLVHGGPTAHVAGAMHPAIAFLTSRGIGVMDVNYGGSTGYGRDYRERLDGQWGVVDVDDVIAAAQGLIDAGIADPERIAIKGGSAGGWTVLSALVRGTPFAAGISRYGVADLRALAADTHDFEARYLDGLVGPLPEAESVYIERSPLTHADRIRVPVLLLQGADDPVVPPSQSEAIRDALATNGVPHVYALYEGESHGFRRASTIIDVAERELAFLGAVFGFTPDDVAPITFD